jgi:hypothetical protein
MPCIKTKCCCCHKQNLAEIRELTRKALEQSNRVISSKLILQTDEIILVQQQCREIRELLLALSDKLMFNN